MWAGYNDKTPSKLVNPIQMEEYTKKHEAKELKPGQVGWEEGKYNIYLAARDDEGTLHFFKGNDAIERIEMIKEQAARGEFELDDEEE